MEPGGRGRMGIALGFLAVLAGLAGLTMEPGRYRGLVFVLLAFFAVRIVLAWARGR